MFAADMVSQVPGIDDIATAITAHTALF